MKGLFSKFTQHYGLISPPPPLHQFLLFQSYGQSFKTWFSHGCQRRSCMCFWFCFMLGQV